MIEKIISIKNVGRFRNCNPSGNVTFKKVTLMFGENGRGKTTLCAILRSLQTGKPEYVLERKTLGASDSASALIRLGGSNYTYGSNGWSGTYSDIVIFDSVFINENVHAGDCVDHEQKKGLYRVIVGPRGVQLARQIEELDGQIRRANIDIKEKKEAASRTLPTELTIERYLALEPIEDIDEKIEQTKAEISRLQLIHDKGEEIQSKGSFELFSLPTLPTSFLTIMSRQLEDIAADAETCVRQQIAAFYMGEQGENWLSQGFNFVTEGKCPFCGQDLSGTELISAYRSHFNAAYKELKEETTGLPQILDATIGESAITSELKTYSDNLVLLEFWKQFLKITLPLLDSEDIRQKYASLRDLACVLVQKKQQSPIELITPNEDFQSALSAVADLQPFIDAYNTTINEANACIERLKETPREETDLITLKSHLVNLEVNKKRFDAEVIQACNDYQTALNLKTDLEYQKDQAKEQLNQYCLQILSTYQVSLNDILEQFNAGFRIVNSRHLYTGGTPCSDYQLEINNIPLNLGDSRTPAGTPCFKTSLSSGDKSALALAFFLSSLKHDAGINDKIIVFDDPFTSQDRFRRVCTQQLICQIATKVKQVIVFSHDPNFLRLLWEKYPSTGIKTLQICRTGDNTFIGEWDIEKETQSNYIKDFSTLLSYYRERVGNPLDVARAIRPFLEGLLRAHFPGHFQPTEWLGDFVNKIRNASISDGLFHAKNDLPEIEAIKDYSKKYHHDQNPCASAEPLSEDELHGFVKRTLRLVGGC